MKNVYSSLVLFIVGIFFFSPVAFSAEDFTVKDVVFHIDGGRVDIPRLQNLLGARTGAQISLSELEQGLGRIAQTGEYQSVAVQVDKGVVNLFLAVANRITKIRLEFEDSGLIEDKDEEEIRQDFLSVLNVSAGDRIDVQVVDSVKKAVQERALQRGFLESRVVVFQNILDEHFSRDLVVSVRLGEKSLITEIQFENLERYSEEDFFSSVRRSSFFSPYYKLFKKIAGVTELPLDKVVVESAMDEVKSSMRSKGYYDFKVDFYTEVLKESQQRLTFKVDVGPKYNLQFEGNVEFWERNLRQSVLEKTLKLNLDFDVNQALRTVVSLYHERGYSDVEVGLEQELSGGEKTLSFKIVEGRQLFLRKLIFTGGLNNNELDIVNQAAKNWFRPIQSPFHKVYYDEKMVKQRQGELLAQIQNFGYLQARILSMRPEIRSDSQFVDIHLQIQLGTQYRIKSISLEGNVILSEDELNLLIPFSPSEVVSPSEVFSSNDKILRAYRNLGFLNARVEEDPSKIFMIHPSRESVDLVFAVDPGPQTLIGRALVEGNLRSKEVVVLRELREESLSEGSPWSPRGQMQLEQDLLSLGIYNTVRVEPVGGRIIDRDIDEELPFERQEKDLKITVSEGPGGSLEFGPGFRTDLGVLGFAEFNYRNLFSENVGLLIRAQGSRKLNNYQFIEQNHSATYLEPYLFGYRVQFRTRIEYSKEDDAIYEDSTPVRGLNSQEVTIGTGIEFKIAKNWRWIQNLYTISLPQLEVFDEDTAAGVRSENYRIGSVGSSLNYDTRDNIFNPRRGWHSTSSIEYASPLLGSDSDVNFFVFRQDVAHYVPLDFGASLALSLNYSHIWGFGGGSRGIPEDRRFVLGGQTSVRSLADKSIRFDQEGVIEQNKSEFKIEYRQPIFYDLSLAFFLDLGYLGVLSPRDVSEGDAAWREGAGFGFRYATPVGPLALDFAFNTDRKSGEDIYQIQFRIGSF